MTTTTAQVEIPKDLINSYEDYIGGHYVDVEAIRVEDVPKLIAAVQANPIRAYLVEEQRRQHLQCEQLERQKARPGQAAWEIESVARQIRDTKAVETYLAAKLRDLPAGAR